MRNPKTPADMRIEATRKPILCAIGLHKWRQWSFKSTDAKDVIHVTWQYRCKRCGAFKTNEE